MKKKNVFLIFSVLFLTILDQITKFSVFNNLNFQSLKVIPNFFSITKNINYGAAFGIFQGGKILFIIITIIVLLYLLLNIKKIIINKLSFLSFALIVSGIVGNLIDRIYFGYVRDFLDFKLFGYNYPIFNLADSYLVIGIILLIICDMKEGKNESRRK